MVKIDLSAYEFNGLEVHQLLCGREIAKDRKSQAHQFAMQMQNYVYLVIDKSSKTATAIDPAWDTAGIKAYAQDLGVAITEATFTHHHPDHV
jgi:glyoxylase-like metal-dependent hydrolase (beta-lactamase superfamily II)